MQYYFNTHKLGLGLVTLTYDTAQFLNKKHTFNYILYISVILVFFILSNINLSWNT